MFSSQNSQVSSAANYIEDVFSTYLYTGNSSTQAINNGIDLSTYGGLVWTKGRQDSGLYHVLSDSASGPNNLLRSNSAAAAFTYTSVGWTVPVFNVNGYTTSDSGYVSQNITNLNQFASWTFRKQPKFFDVVTYAGDGTSTLQVNHNLGATPQFVIVKRTNATGNWCVLAAKNSTTLSCLYLNTTGAEISSVSNYPTSSNYVSPTQFGAGQMTYDFGVADVNAIGSTYVAYLFAHNAGGFGLTGTDNVISCGSYTGNGSTNGPSITLGYEPQWLLVKSASTGGAGYNWVMIDNMRGFPVGSNDALLRANLSDAEVTSVDIASPTATGFNITTSDGGVNGSGQTYIYIAIRRGPMKVPTSGTSVFYPNAIPNANTLDSSNVPFPPDLVNTFSRNGTDRSSVWDLFLFADRLRGLGKPNDTLTASCPALISSSTGAENTTSSYIQLKADGQNITRGGGWVGSLYGDFIYYFIRRAPSFFDEVCYTGTGSAMTIPHNLGVAPEFVIAKERGSSGNNWVVYHSAIGPTGGVFLNLTNAVGTSAAYWNNTAPTATNVYNYGWDWNGGSGRTYVMYLFATCAGVSKVGSYTGTGTTLQVDCGFTGGARFVLIKRTDSTGDWYVWDSARGIVSGNDPYLLLNSTAAETTGTDYIDTYSAGFEISSTAPAAINASGGSFIFLAIA